MKRLGSFATLWAAILIASAVGLMIVLRRNEARLSLLSSVFDHSGEAILITDVNNRVMAVNDAFTEIFGYTLDIPPKK